ncbi:tRNA-intron endonuclease catalytic domain-like protein [Dichomitus squalens LYAD-421 SS1]|uniref:tRNA-intron endonuclease catalytic domain-like protein n=1 Tax=Dichomitus squalens (strain LYAD-421) TaxID=732165 RepID=UPI00044145B8|nr:tRNA-intron endonuclease catalytic domain-like protein [Dichomitus squalens LYAD-421 SS1]EJF62603.1 tRNA-intron endonuclease catalytic domain-like protein [Dichomitus squalens LYAD-421 SS1]
MASDSNHEPKVPLRVSNLKAYVWDVEDVATLRAKHHICGVLAGTLPHLSQQNVFLGLPLVLLPEEVVLLMERQLAVLIDDPNAHTPPSAEALAHWNAVRDSSARQQIVAAETERQSEKAARLSSSEDAIRKRQEREAKRAAAARAKALAEGLAVDEVLLPSPASAPVEDRPATLSKNLVHTFNVTIPASSSELVWYASATSTYYTLETAREAGVWTYPATPYERAKCRVYQDLWEKGSFMGGGIKFGGDFLVYPGDPLRYHSHFVATVVESPEATLMPMEIVAHGRLGTATKKSHLFCEWDEDKEQVTYFSVEWSGFG